MTGRNRPWPIQQPRIFYSERDVVRTANGAAHCNELATRTGNFQFPYYVQMHEKRQVYFLYARSFGYKGRTLNHTL